MPRHLLARLALALACLLPLALLPAGAFAGTTLQIVQGSGEFMSLQTAITVGAPEAITVRWQTDVATATGGTWEVTLASNPSMIMAQGQTGPSPAVGHFAAFTIPATGNESFLATNPPASPVKYNITVIPHDASNHALTPSAAVSVTQVKPAPQTPVNFGPGAVFPDVELVSYVEDFGQVPLTQLQFANATLTVRAVNNGKVDTDPMNLGVLDGNVLMRATAGAQKVAALKPGQSATVTFKLSAVLPAPTSQLPQEAQFNSFYHSYDSQCGVDLRIDLDWAGPQAQAPVNDHSQVYLYQGFHNSKSWQENHPISRVTVCDDKFCAPLIQVARNVYKQIGCKVVGYALFVGDKTTGEDAIYDAFGQARTSSSPPARDMTPSTPMQIASSSKVLTGLTALKVMGAKFDGAKAWTFFPSTWATPAPVVQAITARQFVSMTSGVQQYYAGATGGQSYANLQAFFTQKILNPNAPFSCPGTPHAAVTATATTPAQLAVPPNLPNPIISNPAPCYTDTNFGIMRLVIPRADGLTANDNTTLANKYVSLVQANVWAPLGVTGPACAPPAANTYALLFVYPGQVSWDWGDNTGACGDWGWYVSVEEYSKLLVSLNQADHKVLSDCQLFDVEHNPTTHPVGFDKNNDGAAGHRYLEKNGAEGAGNGTLQTTSVGIFIGHSGCPGKSPAAPMPGIAAALWIDSNINGAAPGVIASTILQNAFEASVQAKP